MKDEGENKMSRRKFPVDKAKLERYDLGGGVDLKKGIKNKIHRQRLRQKEKMIQTMAEQAARTEMLLTEDYGFLENDPGETTTQFKQNDIVSSTDITSVAKHFQLNLEFGPYWLRYSRNGRHLVVGGKKGHVAAFDWVTKKLACEMNVLETVHDVCWLHIETMFAVAQKEWVYIYDNQGIELHCLKRMNQTTHLEFLPYHFLLASSSALGGLTWLDVSIGKIISRYNSKTGKIDVMTQNPSNALLCIGDSKGVVSMWSPNSDQPLAKMLCHNQAISACAVHPYGTYMATSAPNRSLKVWDIRQLSGPVHNTILRSPAQHLSYSQRGLLAIGMGNVVEVFSDKGNEFKAYTRHKTNWAISNLQFCPYEDVLGFGTVKGLSSILVPGSGEANIDAFESNPYQTKKQRKEAEVKALLDKIPSDLINLDTTTIAEIDVPTLKEKVEAKKKLLFVKPKKIDFKPRRTKAKGRGGTAKVVKSKKALKEQAKREFIQQMRESNVYVDGFTPSVKEPKPVKSFGVALDRFVRKPKTGSMKEKREMTKEKVAMKKKLPINVT
ncbi:WD repeat-containing protein 46-like isoform X2 [Copidosoma floridanum]|uniref:WD repeat-containing protein 46 isoform X2 n=1 Tax=Copidosoma floridanum TaxID=29053 RepID=UPI0006C9E5FD|nr:WD repeat-containing protein 46 isoform X2 [Copidosoma floridanum]XP_023245651.1 WD repeat-containing protein 46-like isoform X2 [Copidosoma floridanum]